MASRCTSDSRRASLKILTLWPKLDSESQEALSSHSLSLLVFLSCLSCSHVEQGESLDLFCWHTKGLPDYLAA